MKKLLTIIITLIITISSCHKYIIDDKPSNGDSFTDLQVNKDFSWEMSRVVSLKVKSNDKQVIKVTSVDKTTDYNIGLPSSNNSYEATFSIPTYVEQLSINDHIVEVSDKIEIDLTTLKSVSSDDYYLDFGDAYEFDFPDSPNENYLVKVIDSNYLLVSYNNGQRHYATLGKVNGKMISMGARKVISEGWGRHIDICKISHDKIVVCYTISDGQGTKGYIKIGTISGTDIIYSESTLVSDKSIYDISVDLISDNIFLLSYNEEESGEIILVEGLYQSGNITLSNKTKTGRYTFSEGDGVSVLNPIALGKVGINKFVICFYDSSNNGYLSSFIIGLSNNIYNIGSVTQVSNNDAGISVSMAVINPMKIVVADNPFNLNRKVYLLSVNDDHVTITNSQEIDNNQYSTCNIARINDETFAVSYTYFNLPNNNVPTFKIGKISSNSIDLSEPHQYSNTLCYNNYNFGVNHTLKDNKILLSYRPPKPGRPTSVVIAEYKMNESTIDSDGDGVSDVYDDFPNDPLLSFINYYPSSSFGSVAFEDLYPYKGDYDFNDVVVDFRFEMYSGSDNLVSQVKGVFVPRASGAFFESGFGFSLKDYGNNVGELNVTGSHLSENIIQLNSSGLESGQTHPTIIVFDNFFDIMPSVGGTGVNTTPGYPSVPYDTLIIEVDVLDPISPFLLQIYDWNPFIFVDGERGHEIHLPYRNPTDLVDVTILGVGEAQFDHYKTHDYLPWAIETPEPFSYPKEKQDILGAFNHFRTWAEGYGHFYQDWYKDFDGYRNNEKIY